MYPESDDSRNQISLSINFKWSDVMCSELRCTEYGFITVVAKIPIINAPSKNGRDIWYGDSPAADIITRSLERVRLYDVNNVPINIANGRNNGTYSNNLVNASCIAAHAVGFDGSRSTNVTAIMIPHMVSNTNPMP